MSQDVRGPDIDVTRLSEIAAGVWIIRDDRVPLVPNVGIIVGTTSALVVDTGMGPANGTKVLELARKLAGNRRLMLTLTHFHPEHGYGAQVFKDQALILYNRRQRDDLANKGAAYLEMFRSMGETIEQALRDVALVMPDVVYDGSCDIDLGGLTVELRDWGMAHTRGDQTVFVRGPNVLFTGDLAEERTFPIFPWFPPGDVDVDADRWVEVLTGCAAMDPAIIVPGHGDIGGVEIVRAVLAYLNEVRSDVERSRKDAQTDAYDKATAVASIKQAILARYPDWHQPEWIDFAIRYHFEHDAVA